MSIIIAASLVKELRERTGAGMMECKKALLECAGDLSEAESWVAKHGLRKVQKTADRVAAEGVLVSAISADAKQGVLIEVNSETDFVARDQNFNQFCQQLSLCALELGENDLDALNKSIFDPATDKTVEMARQELVARIGENIQIRRLVFIQVSTGCLANYVHGGRIGVLLHLDNMDTNLARDLAMHVAALNPEVVYPEELSPQRLEKERAIFAAQAEDQGKPPEITEKMIAGRMSKFVNEICLLGQPFIKDPDLSVSSLLQKSQAKVLSFTRYAVGEGIEKKQVDFAQEVMATVRGSN
jgi:elongation factor Ts